MTLRAHHTSGRLNRTADLLSLVPSDCEYRVDAPPTGDSSPVDGLGTTDVRSNGHEADVTSSGVLQPVPRSASLHCRHHVLRVDSLGHVRLSIMGNVQNEMLNNLLMEDCSDSDRALLAEQSLVPCRVVGPASRLSSTTRDATGSPRNAPQWDFPWVDLFPGPSRLSSICRQAVDHGYSSAVSRRVGTGQLYETLHNLSTSPSG